MKILRGIIKWQTVNVLKGGQSLMKQTGGILLMKRTSIYMYAHVTIIKNLLTYLLTYIHFIIVFTHY